MISTLMFTSPAKIKLSSRSSIHYWKTKSKYWVDCWELNFQKFEELDLTGFYCVIIYWYDWLQCTCSKLTQVQDIMRHGLTFKTSNKQLNRPSSAYRGIFWQIKHTYFIFFESYDKKNHYVQSTTEFSVPNQLLYVCWLSI